MYSQTEYGENHWYEDTYADESVWICDQSEDDCDEVEGNFILLDGHNRYEICIKHNISFSKTEIKVENRQAAINWIINNQLGRRNLHPDQASYLRGKRYNAEKQDHGGQVRGSRDQNDPSIERTADRLATEYKVSAPTIKRDGNYAAKISTRNARIKMIPANPPPTASLLNTRSAPRR